MKKTIYILIFLTSLFITSNLFSQPAAVTGTWRTFSDDGKEESIVEIYEQGGKVYGKITKLVDPLDENGKPHTCTECSDENKDKPVLGMVIIKGLGPDGDKWSGGKILDPNDGNWYKCFLKAIENGKKLEVRGYIGFSLLGRTQYWVRK
ncbi:hypothetical protein CH373_17575 [Leptospira perolatii]|uniref:DUF2147 domain-containing protein n=1 Tax=Leptospira perolatii TaxID=2023191 RepID=A0A2M9ZIF5_9LEPT|nr:DUF2147 domain-containing protein [Leptospira perolatii]PJZ69083.1 hypothetical protein CH360_12420 [Leptospira perolatii]PJZ71792.1 hypothetical protein CH373_17575 [Leptospira perolatii]